MNVKKTHGAQGGFGKCAGKRGFKWSPGTLFWLLSKIYIIIWGSNLFIQGSQFDFCGRCEKNEYKFIEYLLSDILTNIYSKT